MTCSSSITPRGSTKCYIVATALPRPHEAELLMSEPVDHFERAVRQAVFDRMSVAYLVSDRFEPDPGWPVVAQGTLGRIVLRDPAQSHRPSTRLRRTRGDGRERAAPVHPLALPRARSPPIGHHGSRPAGRVANRAPPTLHPGAVVLARPRSPHSPRDHSSARPARRGRYLDARLDRARRWAYLANPAGKRGAASHSDS